MDKGKVDLTIPELPKPDEKLLRAPTFFEKYHWAKLLILCGLLLLILISAVSYVRQSEEKTSTTPSTVPTQTIYVSPTVDVTANWIQYNNKLAKFQLKYPSDYTLNEYVPTDAQSVQLLSPVLPQINTNFRLTISYKNIVSTQTLPDLIEQYKLCPSISGQEGVPSLINGAAPARIYFDTPCGQYLTTVVYTIQGDMLYIITVDSQASYTKIQKYVDQIISTLTFTSAEEISQTDPTVPAPSEKQYFCTLDAKLCPDGSSVGRHGPKCEFAPCPGEAR